MCEEIPIHYKDGDIVWVKLDLCWWPGKVIDFEALPEDYQDDFSAGQKRPLVVVSFFQEKHYEFVMNLNRIYSYNCAKKDDFIKRALDLMRARRGSMDKFPDDIKMAEELTGGDEDILSDPKYAPQKRRVNSWSELFGSPKPETPPTGRGRPRSTYKSPRTATSSTNNSPNVVHPRFSNKNDNYQVRVLIQNKSESEPTEQKYFCDRCNFETSRIDVIIIHKKAHLEGRCSSPTDHSPSSRSPEKSSRSPQKKFKFPVSKTNTIDEDIALLEQGISLTDHESDCDEEFIEVIKVKTKRKSKTGVSAKKSSKKKLKLEEEKVKVEEKKDIRVDLLAEWDDDEEEETVNNNDNLDTSISTFKSKPITPKKEDEDSLKIDSKVSLEKNQDVSSEKEKELTTKKDANLETEKELSLENDKELSTEKVRKFSTEKERELTTKKEKEEDKSCFDFDDEEDNQMLTAATSSGRKIPRVIPEKRKSSEPIEPLSPSKPDHDFEAELNKFAEVLESTTAPVAPELPSSNLKCEQNFHYSKAKKSPDKPKIINIKKRFVKSFEDFEQSVNVEMDESGVESIREIDCSQKLKDDSKVIDIPIAVENIPEEKVAIEPHDEETEGASKIVEDFSAISSVIEAKDINIDMENEKEGIENNTKCETKTNDELTEEKLIDETGESVLSIEEKNDVINHDIQVPVEESKISSQDKVTEAINEEATEFPSKSTIAKEDKIDEKTIAKEDKADENTMTKEVKPYKETIPKKAKPYEETITKEVKPYEETITKEVKPCEETITKEEKADEITMVTTRSRDRRSLASAVQTIVVTKSNEEESTTTTVNLDDKSGPTTTDVEEASTSENMKSAIKIDDKPSTNDQNVDLENKVKDSSKSGLSDDTYKTEPSKVGQSKNAGYLYENFDTTASESTEEETPKKKVLVKSKPGRKSLIESKKSKKKRLSASQQSKEFEITRTERPSFLPEDDNVIKKLMSKLPSFSTELDEETKKSFFSTSTDDDSTACHLHSKHDDFKKTRSTRSSFSPEFVFSSSQEESTKKTRSTRSSLPAGNDSLKKAKESSLIIENEDFPAFEESSKKSRSTRSSLSKKEGLKESKVSVSNEDLSSHEEITVKKMKSTRSSLPVDEELKKPEDVLYSSSQEENTVKKTRSTRSSLPVDEELKMAEDVDSSSHEENTVKKTRSTRSSLPIDEELKKAEDVDSSSHEENTVKKTRLTRSSLPVDEELKMAEDVDSSSHEENTVKKTRSTRSSLPVDEELKKAEDVDSSSHDEITMKKTRPTRSSLPVDEELKKAEDVDSSSHEDIPVKKTRSTRSSLLVDEELKSAEDVDSFLHEDNPHKTRSMRFSLPANTDEVKKPKSRKSLLSSKKDDSLIVPEVSEESTPIHEEHFVKKRSTRSSFSATIDDDKKTTSSGEDLIKPASLDTQEIPKAASLKKPKQRKASVTDEDLKKAKPSKHLSAEDSEEIESTKSSASKSLEFTENAGKVQDTDVRKTRSTRSSLSMEADKDKKKKSEDEMRTSEFDEKTKETEPPAIEEIAKKAHDGDVRKTRLTRSSLQLDVEEDTKNKKSIKEDVDEFKEVKSTAVDEEPKKTKSVVEESGKKTRTTRSSLPSNLEEHSMMTRSTKPHPEEDPRESKTNANQSGKKSKSKTHAEDIFGEESNTTQVDYVKTEESTKKTKSATIEEEKKLDETLKKNKSSRSLLDSDVKKTRSTRSSLLHEVSEDAKKKDVELIETDKAKKSRLRSSLSPDFKDEVKKPKLKDEDRKKTRSSLPNKDSKKYNEEKAAALKQKEEEEKKRSTSSIEEKLKKMEEDIPKESNSPKPQEELSFKKNMRELPIKKKIKPNFDEVLSKIDMEIPIIKTTRSSRLSTRDLEETLKRGFTPKKSKIDTGRVDDLNKSDKKKEEISEKTRTTRSSSSHEIIDLKKIKEKKHVSTSLDEDLKRMEKKKSVSPHIEENLKIKEKFMEKTRESPEIGSSFVDLGSSQEETSTASEDSTDAHLDMKKVVTETHLDTKKVKKMPDIHLDMKKVAPDTHLDVKKVKKIPPLVPVEIYEGAKKKRLNKLDITVEKIKKVPEIEEAPKNDGDTSASQMEETKELDDTKQPTKETKISCEDEIKKIKSRWSSLTAGNKDKEKQAPAAIEEPKKIKKKWSELSTGTDKAKEEESRKIKTKWSTSASVDTIARKKSRWDDEEPRKVDGTRKIKSKWTLGVINDDVIRRKMEEKQLSEAQVVAKSSKFDEKEKNIKTHGEDDEITKKKSKSSDGGGKEINKATVSEIMEKQSMSHLPATVSMVETVCDNEESFLSSSDKLEKNIKKSSWIGTKTFIDKEEIHSSTDKLGKNINKSHMITTKTWFKTKEIPSAIDKLERKKKKSFLVETKTSIESEELNTNVPITSPLIDLNTDRIEEEMKTIIASSVLTDSAETTESSKKQLSVSSLAKSIDIKMQSAKTRDLEETFKRGFTPKKNKHESFHHVGDLNKSEKEEKIPEQVPPSHSELVEGGLRLNKFRITREKQYINKKIKQKMSRLEESPPKKKPHYDSDEQHKSPFQMKKAKTRWSSGALDEEEQDESRKKVKLSVESDENKSEGEQSGFCLKVSKLKSRLMDKLNESEVEMQRPKGKNYINQKTGEKMERLQRRRSSAKSPRRLSLQSHEISIEKTSDNTVEVFSVNEDVKKLPIEESKIESILRSPGLPLENDENSALNTLATISELSSYDLKADINIEKNLTVVSESDLGDTQVEIAKIPIIEEGTIKATTVASFSVDFTEDLNVLENKKRTKSSESDSLDVVRLPPPFEYGNSERYFMAEHVPIYGESSEKRKLPTKIPFLEDTIIPVKEHTTIVLREDSTIPSNEESVLIVEEGSSSEIVEGLDRPVIVEVPVAIVTEETAIEGPIPIVTEEFSGSIAEERTIGIEGSDVTYATEAVVPLTEASVVIVAEESAVPVVEENILPITGDPVTSISAETLEVTATETPIALVTEELSVIAISDESVVPLQNETIPITEETTLSITEETTPNMEETTLSITEKTTIPITEGTIIPNTKETTVPILEEISPPITEATPFPTTEEMTRPILEETTIPTTEKTMLISKETTIPITEETTPIVEEIIPTTEETTIPTKEETTIPIMEETMATTEECIITETESVIPVVEEAVVPATNEFDVIAAEVPQIPIIESPPLTRIEKNNIMEESSVDVTGKITECVQIQPATFEAELKSTLKAQTLESTKNEAEDNKVVTVVETNKVSEDIKICQDKAVENDTMSLDTQSKQVMPEPIVSVEESQVHLEATDSGEIIKISNEISGEIIEHSSLNNCETMTILTTEDNAEVKTLSNDENKIFVEQQEVEVQKMPENSTSENEIISDDANTESTISVDNNETKLIIENMNTESTFLIKNNENAEIIENISKIESNQIIETVSTEITGSVSTDIVDMETKQMVEVASIETIKAISDNADKESNQTVDVMENIERIENTEQVIETVVTEDSVNIEENMETIESVSAKNIDNNENQELVGNAIEFNTTTKECEVLIETPVVVDGFAMETSQSVAENDNLITNTVESIAVVHQQHEYPVVTIPEEGVKPKITIQEDIIITHEDKIIPKSRKIDVLSDVKLPDTRNVLKKQIAIPPKKLVQKKFFENSLEMEMAKLTDTNMETTVVQQPQESTTSTKLLEILTDTKVTQSLKIANPKFELDSLPTITKPKTKLLIRSSIPGGATTKSIIIPEKMIKTTDGVHRTSDSDGIETFVIRKKDVAGGDAGKKLIKKPGIFKPSPSTSSAASDDNVFDIDSMPIVLTDQILTPENIDNVPIMIQQEKAQPSKMRLLNKTPPMSLKDKLGFRPQKVFQGKQPITTSKGKVIMMPAEPSSSKYTVGKRIIKRSPIIATTAGARVQEPTGNKIMIVTNNQGQQSRVVLTPAQQKLIGYQGPGYKKVVKKTGPNILSQTIINPKGQIRTTQMITTTPSPPVIVKKKVEASRNKLLGQKLTLQGSLNQLKPGQQRTIIIKNPQGQTVKKIQGTDDALLEKQVQEQIQAINRATWSQNAANKQQVPKKFVKKPVVSESTKLALQHKAHSSGSKLASVIPPLSPLAKKSEAVTKPRPVTPKAIISAAQSDVEKKETIEKQRAPHQLVIQDALGNQTTITEGQILALPSETVDGQPQSYMLVTLDETGNLTPLNNEALMSLDPNLNLGGDLSNMVLQIDQSGVNAESAVESPAVPAVTQEIPAVPQEALPVPQEVAAVPQQAKVEEVVTETPAASVEAVGTQQAIACAINNGETNQQLIITGDPASTQKFLESLSEGNADLANLLANAEGNILIHADGQQILINTDSENQMLLQVNPDGAAVTESNEHSGNPIFSSPVPKNQDILAAALADTDVFQQEQSIVATKPLQSQLSPTVPTLYPMNVNNVLETSSMSSPIMTPLEVPSTNAKKIEAETDILSQVSKNVDLPITITDPNISQTVANQQAALMSSDLHANLDLPLAIQDVTVTSAEMNSPSFGYSLPSLDDSVDMQKSFSNSISMPLLTEMPEDVTSAPVPESMEVEIPENTQEETVTEEPMKIDDTDDDKKDDSQYLLSTSGMTSINNQMCSSLSEPPPDMFDYDQGYDPKQQSMEISPAITESPVDDDFLENDKTESESEQASNSPSTNSTDSCEIPVQPEIELRNYEEDKL